MLRASAGGWRVDLAVKRTRCDGEGHGGRKAGLRGEAAGHCGEGGGRDDMWGGGVRLWSGFLVGQRLVTRSTPRTGRGGGKLECRLPSTQL